MKNNLSVKNIDLSSLTSQSKPKNKFKQQRQSPLKLDLKLKLHSHNSKNGSDVNKVSQSKSKEKDQSSTDYLTERTNPINQFNISLKDHAIRNLNITSYLRIKPDGLLYIPGWDMPNDQTILYDRSIYKFNRILGAQSSQEQVYDFVGKQVTQRFLEGYNGTIFAYGSTGSGKTYTMFGHDDGIVPMVIRDIFQKINSSKSRLSCSMIQIYREKLIDLLADDSLQLKIKDSTPNLIIKNLSIHQVSSPQQTLVLIKKGNYLKKIRETNLNEQSSRSHIIFTFYLQQMIEEKRTSCRFNLVDLAGSQKVCRSKVEGEGLEQAKKINLSLSCLGNTISALVKGSDHIPYRQSKLTRILKQSLMGNSITRLIVTCSLAQDSIEQTISSIKFAQRAQKIQTNVEIAYNVNKFKGEKQQRMKMLYQRLQQAERKISKIRQIVQDDSDCGNCLKVSNLIRDCIQIDEIDLKLRGFGSPKQRVDLKNFFTVQNNHTAECKLQHEDNSVSEFKDMHIKTLKKDNQLLQLQIKKLNSKIKSLEQKLDKAENRNSKRQDKENQFRSVNRKIIKIGTEKSLKPKDNTPPKMQTVQHLPNQQKVDLKTNDSNANIESTASLLLEAVTKFDRATEDYLLNTRSVEIDILNQQIQDLLTNSPQKNQNLKVLLAFRMSYISLMDELTSIVSQICHQSVSQLRAIYEHSFQSYLSNFSGLKHQIHTINLSDQHQNENFSMQSFCSQNEFLMMHRPYLQMGEQFIYPCNSEDF